MTANSPRDDGPCSVPGCGARAPFGFSWGGVTKRACLAHRARGAAWLAIAKSAGQPDSARSAGQPASAPAAPPPGGQDSLRQGSGSQGVLL